MMLIFLVEYQYATESAYSPTMSEPPLNGKIGVNVQKIYNTNAE